MSDAAYYREYRKRPKFKRWLAQHEATPARIEQQRKASRKWRKANPKIVARGKAKYRSDGRAYARAVKDCPCADCGQRFP
ncbi:hypothetical protein LCGC14_2133760, partial [marine sediment metagenome]